MVCEVVTFQVLREQLRCKEVWVVGADSWRNPDEDLPADCEDRCHYPHDPDCGTHRLRAAARRAVVRQGRALLVMHPHQQRRYVLQAPGRRLRQRKRQHREVGLKTRPRGSPRADLVWPAPRADRDRRSLRRPIFAWVKRMRLSDLWSATLLRQERPNGFGVHRVELKEAESNARDGQVLADLIK